MTPSKLPFFLSSFPRSQNVCLEIIYITIVFLEVNCLMQCYASKKKNYSISGVDCVSNKSQIPRPILPEQARRNHDLLLVLLPTYCCTGQISSLCSMISAGMPPVGRLRVAGLSERRWLWEAAGPWKRPEGFLSLLTALGSASKVKLSL